MNERIRELRKTLNLTQTAFAERIGLAYNTVTNYEAGRRNPTTAIITSICREFNVNENWLLTGEGEMFNELTRDEMVARLVGQALSTDDEFIIKTFEALGQLSPAEWDVVKKIVDTIKGE